MKCCLHQLYKEVLDSSLAVTQTKQTFLQGREAGNILRHIEANHLSVTMQELNHSQAVCERRSRKDQAGNTGQLWQRLESFESIKKSSKI